MPDRPTYYENNINSEFKVLAPQPGPQTLFASTPADIAIYGGAAGGGKTWALLLDPLRHMNNSDFGAVFFRRTYPQITNVGGMWDESEKIYPEVNARPTVSALEWKMPSGATFVFKHMQHDKDKLQWQGSQVPFFGFDELTHFTADVFFYMLSRSRSMCGVRPYVRGTTNPDANSWVKDLVMPWIDTAVHEDDRPHSGELLYFVRRDGEIHWVEPGYSYMENGILIKAKSLTFIRASVFDNKKLLATDPDYLANLKSLPVVEQERLLYGNWDIVESGNMFRQEWFNEITEAMVPEKFKSIVRFWDFASSKPSLVEKRKSDPDYTAGVLLGLTRDNRYILIDLILARDTPEYIQQLVRSTAEYDKEKYGDSVLNAMEIEPGSSGQFVADHIKSTVLKGFRFKAIRSTGSKIARAKPISAEVQKGTVDIVTGYWNQKFFGMATAFPSPEAHDDPVDALSGAYNLIHLPIDEFIYRPMMVGVSGWQSSGGGGFMARRKEHRDRHIDGKGKFRRDTSPVLSRTITSLLRERSLINGGH